MIKFQPSSYEQHAGLEIGNESLGLLLSPSVWDYFFKDFVRKNTKFGLLNLEKAPYLRGSTGPNKVGCDVRVDIIINPNTDDQELLDLLTDLSEIGFNKKEPIISFLIEICTFNLVKNESERAYYIDVSRSNKNRNFVIHYKEVLPLVSYESRLSDLDYFENSSKNAFLVIEGLLEKAIEGYMREK